MDKPEAFGEQMKKGEFSSVYLFFGEDGPAIDRAVREVSARVLAEGFSEFNADYFYGKEAEVGEVVAACETLPMMAERRLVVFRRVEETKGASRERLLSYLGSPNPTTVLVLVAGELAVKGANAKKEDKALVEAVEKKGRVVYFPNPRPEELPDVVRKLVRARGKKIERLAVETFLELSGGELRGLEQEVEKLLLFVGEGDLITREEVLAACADIKAAGIFEFTDALTRRDTESALRALKKLREQGQELLMILGMALRHFRQFFAVQEYAGQGETAPRIARLTGINEWVLKKSYLPYVNQFLPADFNRIFGLFSELDLKLKSTRTDKELLFERAVIELCSGRRV
ncbi:MAG: DNA polymerase III subunit delta [candidate division WOR-3 bacterium]